MWRNDGDDVLVKAPGLAARTVAGSAAAVWRLLGAPQVTSELVAMALASLADPTRPTGGGAPAPDPATIVRSVEEAVAVLVGEDLIEAVAHQQDERADARGPDG